MITLAIAQPLTDQRLEHTDTLRLRHGATATPVIHAANTPIATWSEREKPVRAYRAERSALSAVARLENSISVAIREGRLHEPSGTYFVRYADR